jgi:hypothetical protein
MSAKTKKNMSVWLKGLGVAVLSGAVAAVADPAHIATDPTGTGIRVGMSALVSVIAYLKASPLEPSDVEDDTPSSEK